MIFQPGSGSGAKVAVGEYVGAGTSGADNTNKLIFNFKPYLVIISCNKTGFIPVVFARNQDGDYSAAVQHRNSEYENYLWSIVLSSKWTQNAVEWYATYQARFTEYGGSGESIPINSFSQLNSKGYNYSYIALGI